MMPSTVAASARSTHAPSTSRKRANGSSGAAHGSLARATARASAWSRPHARRVARAAPGATTTVIVRSSSAASASAFGADDASVVRAPRPAYVPGVISDPNYVRVFDTTLRDGEQSPGATLTSKEKLDIATSLAKLGVDIIEAGFPIASPDDLEAVRNIAKKVGNEVYPDGYVPVICGLSRANKKDIDAAWEGVRHALRPRIHTFIATSPIHMESKLRKTPDEVVEIAVNAVKYARSLGCVDVEFSPEDAGRSEPEFLYRILSAVVEAGATTLNIPDTVGFCLPDEFGTLIAGIKANVKGIEGAVISTHCQNDLGLSTANSLAGVANGARQVECTINGIGERAGNASLEEVAMAIYMRGQARLMGAYTGINPVYIYPSSQMVKNFSGMAIQPHKAIVGANAFAHESGIHQDGMLKNKLTYEIIAPETIGYFRGDNDVGVVMGKHSGRHALSSKLKQLGVPMEGAELDAMFTRFKLVAETKLGGVNDDELLAIVRDGESVSDPAWALESVQVVCGTMGLPTATVKMIAKDGTAHISCVVGTGPVDAVFKAIDALVRLEVVLTEYRVTAVTAGINALAETTVAIKPKEGTEQKVGTSVFKTNLQTGEKGLRTFTATGADTDIVVSSARAYVIALNRMVEYVAKSGTYVDAEVVSR